MEFDFGEDPDFADEILRKVKEVRAVPVIAHAERYEFIQEDPEIAYHWKRRGYEIQVNKGRLYGQIRPAGTAYGFRTPESQSGDRSCKRCTQPDSKDDLYGGRL